MRLYKIETWFEPCSVCYVLAENDIEASKKVLERIREILGMASQKFNEKLKYVQKIEYLGEVIL
jgi:hypothetical protein